MGEDRAEETQTRPPNNTPQLNGLVDPQLMQLDEEAALAAGGVGGIKNPAVMATARTAFCRGCRFSYLK
jgi:hypothetical protein